MDAVPPSPSVTVHVYCSRSMALLGVPLTRRLSPTSTLSGKSLLRL